MINLKNFNSSLLKIDKKHCKGINIYSIRYITIKTNDHYESIYSKNPFYLLINHASGYVEEKNGNKYLIFDSAELRSTDENKEVLTKYNEVWNGIKNEIKAINDNKENYYQRDLMKSKFNSDDDLPLNKPLKFHATTIIIRSFLKEDGKLYPQVFLDYLLYDV